MRTDDFFEQYEPSVWREIIVVEPDSIYVAPDITLNEAVNCIHRLAGMISYTQRREESERARRAKLGRFPSNNYPRKQPESYADGERTDEWSDPRRR